MPITAKIQELLIKVAEEVEKEDQSVRESQLRQWRYYNFLWEGFANVYWDEVAHDWRIFDNIVGSDDSDQADYDRPINILRAYLESIIAALSISIPPIKCYPDDANNPLDLSTCQAGDKIGQLLYRHNDAPLKWLHSLFTFSKMGMIAAHTFSEANEDFGTYKRTIEKDEEATINITKCPSCGVEFQSDPVIKEKVEQQSDKFNPGPEDVVINNELMEGEICPSCLQMVIPQLLEEKVIITRIIEDKILPKSRVFMKIYGGLNVKIPNYAKNQKQCPYLRLSEEFNYVNILEQYPDLEEDTDFRKKLVLGSSTNVSGYIAYEQWARLSPQYGAEYPVNIVTKNTYWLRPAAFNFLQKDDATALKKAFPNGAKVVFANDTFCEAVNESLDDCWTIIENPLSDFVHFQPEASLLTSVQSITNDLISLIFQTIQHGISQTFADDGVLDFDAYKASEVLVGGVFPVTPKSGKSISESFHDLKTATLSPEVMPFQQQIQSLGQLASGALPSLFGGAIEGSETASEYSMSRAQALQRQNNKYKMFTSFWKKVFSKMIPLYIDLQTEDERHVERNKDGGFVNTFIRKAELEGKIGRIELEANENLPLTWAQRSEKISKLMESNSPQIMAILNAPENLPLLHEALGLTDFSVPGEDDVILQYDEIRILLNSEPIEDISPETGELQEVPSVEVDPVYNNHQIHFDIVKKWVTSEEGQQTKVTNEAGFRNVVLHGIEHYKIINMQAQMAQQAQGAAPGAKPKETNQEAPIMGEENVSANA